MNSKLVVAKQTIKMMKLQIVDNRIVETEVQPDNWLDGDEKHVTPYFWSEHRQAWYNGGMRWFADEDHRKHAEQDMRNEVIAEWAAQWGI